MSSVKVSALTAKTSPSGSEEVLINDGGTSKKITIANLTKGHDLPTVPSGIDTDTNKEYNLKLTDVSGTETLTWIEETDNDTTYSTVTTSVDGLAPTLPATHGSKFLRGDATWVVPTDTDTTYSTATATTEGLVKIEDDTTQTVAANTVSTTASRTYGVQLNSSDQAVVNVPWSDTDTNTNQLTTFTVSATTDTTPTTISQGDDLMFTAGTGITCETTADGTVTISNTVTDTDTTYSTATTSTEGLVKIEDGTAQSTAANAVTTTASRTYGVQLNASDQAVVNVPWTDTDTGITDVVDDTTPQLGGNLDLNGNNITGTGAIPAANITGTISGVNFKDVGLTTNAIGSIGGGTQDIDLTLGNSVSGTVDTSTTTFTFSNPTASDELCIFSIVLTNGGSQTVNFPASVDWEGGTAPTLTAAGVDILIFATVDGGTIWHGQSYSLDSKTPS